jgi:site-specific DNA recombinase
MRVALYARVSTQRQGQTQTSEQQLSRLEAHLQQQGWTVPPEQIYQDEGVSGATLSRPGLDALRDRAALAELDVVLITAPDRLARKYVHQVLLIEELERHGCRVEFLERPMSQDPNDQLLLQIRGAVAEYERTLIAERLRRGRVSRLRAGQLLPWVRVPFGYQVDPASAHPAGLRCDRAPPPSSSSSPGIREGATLKSVVGLRADQIPSPTGKGSWARSSVCGSRQRAYTGTTYGNCTRMSLRSVVGVARREQGRRGCGARGGLGADPRPCYHQPRFSQVQEG